MLAIRVAESQLAVKSIESDAGRAGGSYAVVISCNAVISACEKGVFGAVRIGPLALDAGHAGPRNAAISVREKGLLVAVLIGFLGFEAGHAGACNAAISVCGRGMPGAGCNGSFESDAGHDSTAISTCETGPAVSSGLLDVDAGHAGGYNAAMSACEKGPVFVSIVQSELDVGRRVATTPPPMLAKRVCLVPVAVGLTLMCVIST